MLFHPWSDKKIAIRLLKDYKKKLIFNSCVTCTTHQTHPIMNIVSIGSNLIFYMGLRMGFHKRLLVPPPQPPLKIFQKKPKFCPKKILSMFHLPPQKFSMPFSENKYSMLVQIF